jgi:hypothetical protein
MPGTQLFVVSPTDTADKNYKNVCPYNRHPLEGSAKEFRWGGRAWVLNNGDWRIQNDGVSCCCQVVLSAIVILHFSISITH